jgi:microcystin-dependent protein
MSQDPVVVELVRSIAALEDQMGRMVARTLVTVAADNVPIGAILPFGGSTPPSGYLLCDGTSYAASAYPQLSAVIGYTFGGSGANFNVPDCRGKVLAAYKSGDAYFGTLGASVGFPDVTISSAQMPSHTHTPTIYGVTPSGGSSSGTVVEGGGGAVNLNNSNTSTGGGGSHTNVQPSLVVNAIIRAA